MLLARKFDLTKTCESLLAVYDCCLAHPTSSYTPPHCFVPQFRGLWLLMGSCSCPLVKCTLFNWGSFLSRFVYPKFRSLQRLKVEVWTSAENQRETHLKELTASVDEALLALVFANPKPQPSRSSKGSVLTYLPCYFTVPTSRY